MTPTFKKSHYRCAQCDMRDVLRGICATVYAFLVSLLIIWGINEVNAETGTEKPATQFKILISWDAPTSLEDGTPLPLEHITGFDVFHSLDGVASDYLEWVPVQSEPHHTWHHQTVTTGKHCYQLRTVTEKYGKSKRSVMQCVELIANPDAPENVTVEKLEKLETTKDADL